MSTEKEASTSTAKPRLSFTACFDALWFCYSPVYQMQQYYRVGKLDNCSGKWTAMVDCLLLKTKSASKVEGRPKVKGRVFEGISELINNTRLGTVACNDPDLMDAILLDDETSLMEEANNGDISYLQSPKT